MSEGEGEMVDGVVEVVTEGKMFERGGEAVHIAVEIYT